jgi:hypothetical protein
VLIGDPPHKALDAIALIPLPVSKRDLVDPAHNVKTLLWDPEFAQNVSELTDVREAPGGLRTACLQVLVGCQLYPYNAGCGTDHSGIPSRTRSIAAQPT